jgi:hypothetical protein
MNPTGTTLALFRRFRRRLQRRHRRRNRGGLRGKCVRHGFTNSPELSDHDRRAANSLPGNSSNPNAFVTKVNTAREQLCSTPPIWAEAAVSGGAIAVDHSGNAYVTGTPTSIASGSTLFPLVNPISSTPSAGFLTEVNSAGTAFVYSTFLKAGIGYGVAVDSGGDAYVTGSTGNIAAPNQGYVLKVNAGGSGMAYGPVFLGTAAGCRP